MPIHPEVSPLKNTVVTLPSGVMMGSKAPVTDNDTFQVEVEDWYDRLNNKSWMVSDGNIACLNYAMRSAFANLPLDNEVLYGHAVDSGHGFLFHVNEIVSED